MEKPRGNSHLRFLRASVRESIGERHPQSLSHRKPEPLGRHVTLAEDASRIRINPGFMARLRSQALSIVRANGVTNIAKAIWTAALDPTVSLSYTRL
jgi:hypothetical protein